MQDIGQRSAAVCALGAALVGGTIGWIVAFSGLVVWGLLIGLAAMVSILALVGRARPYIRFATLAAFGFASVLLTWPLLWLIVGYIRYAITGDTLGE